MSRAMIFLVAVLLFLTSGSRQAMSQASKQLNEKAKEAESAQQNSWKHVDEINKETDRTKARLQQSRQSGTQPVQRSGYTVKKTHIGTGSAYKKANPYKAGAKKK